MITDEYQLKAARTMSDAAERAQDASNRMEQSAQRIAFLLEDGYGGNGLKLIELLETAKTEGSKLELLKLAVDNFLADGRPHGGRNTQFPDGCECDICQSWDNLNNARTNLAI